MKVQFEDPANLATENELLEQANIALKAFERADDGDNNLVFKELCVLMEDLGLPVEDDEEEALFEMDTDGSGGLSIKEWLVWWLRRVGQSPNPAKQMEALAINTFKKFDQDSSGSIDKVEMRKLVTTLGADFTDSELNEAIYQLDKDKSGLIEMQEFVDWWADRASQNRQSGGLIAMKLRKLASKALITFQTDIFKATWNGDSDLVEQFLEGDPRLALAVDVSEFGDNWSALHYAAYQGHKKIVAQLLQAAPSKDKLVNKQNALGFTPIFYAAQRDHLDIVEMLLDDGANPGLYGTPYPEGDPDLVLCPADLAVFNKDLYKMLKNNSRCAAPEELSVEKLGEVTLDGKSSKLIFTIPSEAIGRICKLPIKSFKVELSQNRTAEAIKASKATTPPTQTFIVNASAPKTQTEVSVTVDTSWVRSLIPLDENNVKVTVKISAKSALGDSGPLSDAKQVRITSWPQKKEKKAAPPVFVGEAEAAAMEAADALPQAANAAPAPATSKTEKKLSKAEKANEAEKTKYRPVPPKMDEEDGPLKVVETPTDEQDESLRTAPRIPRITKESPPELQAAHPQVAALNKSPRSINTKAKVSPIAKPTVGSSVMREGDKVEGNYGGAGKWYRGVISKMHANGTLNVDYDDGDAEVGVPMVNVRSLELPRQTQAPQVSQKQQLQSLGGGASTQEFSLSDMMQTDASLKKGKGNALSSLGGESEVGKSKEKKAKSKSPEKKGRKLSPRSNAAAPSALQKLTTQPDGEFSFADMIAADEARKAASAAPQGGEGEFSFADMIAADDAAKNQTA